MSHLRLVPPSLDPDPDCDTCGGTGTVVVTPGYSIAWTCHCVPDPPKPKRQEPPRRPGDQR